MKSTQARRRALLIAAAVGIVLLIVATVWLLLLGTRGAEIATVLAFPAMVLIGVTGLLLEDLKSSRASRKDSSRVVTESGNTSALKNANILWIIAGVSLLSVALASLIGFRILAPPVSLGGPSRPKTEIYPPVTSSPPAIAVAEGPWRIIVTPDGNRAYLTNRDQSVVSVIDTRTEALIKTISVWARPVGLAVTPDGRFVYVTRQTFDDRALPEPDTGIVTVIDTTSNKVIDEIRIAAGGNIVDVAITPDGRYAYLTESNSRTIVTVDTTTRAIYQVPFFTDSPGHIAFSPDSKRAYVTNLYAQDVVTIDATTKAQLGHVEIDAKEVVASPSGDRIYVTTDSSTVAVIDTSTNQIINSIAVAGGAEGLAVTKDGRRLCVVNPGGNTLSIIDTTRNSVDRTIPVGQNPQDVALTPDGARAFVTNWKSNSVSVINLPTS